LSIESCLCLSKSEAEGSARRGCQLVRGRGTCAGKGYCVGRMAVLLALSLRRRGILMLRGRTAEGRLARTAGRRRRRNRADMVATCV
jgi:hypothetical protein